MAECFDSLGEEFPSSSLASYSIVAAWLVRSDNINIMFAVGG